MKCISGTSKFFVLGNTLSNIQNINLSRILPRHREGMFGNQTGHLWDLLLSNLLVEDFALRITSDDKVVKQGFVTVMVLSAQVLNLWNPFSWGGRRGGGR